MNTDNNDYDNWKLASPEDEDDELCSCGEPVKPGYSECEHCIEEEIADRKRADC